MMGIPASTAQRCSNCTHVESNVALSKIEISTLDAWTSSCSWSSSANLDASGSNFTVSLLERRSRGQQMSRGKEQGFTAISKTGAHPAVETASFSQLARSSVPATRLQYEMKQSYFFSAGDTA